MRKALVMSPEDNVAVVITPLKGGELLRLAGKRKVRAQEPIEFGHKIALSDIARGEKVIKYGHPIGLATADIAEGCHVDVHNLESCRGRGDLS